MFIENIILSRDRRGVSTLKTHLAPDFCQDAAKLIYDNRRTAFIVTGFYIMAKGAPETDGPPGAIALGKALEAMGCDVYYVTDKHAKSIMETVMGQGARIVDFPITDHRTSRRFARDLLLDLCPSVLVSIERCSFTKDRVYLNRQGKDISEFTAKVDYLFLQHENTVGIGDGGNEIGMGKLADEVAKVSTLAKDPARTATTKLVIASVSNWGAYGLVAGLSMLHGKNLLMSAQEEKDIIKGLVDSGATEPSNTPKYGVDSFSPEENSQTILELHRFLDANRVPR
ncbi:MAG: DUF4392 domain-containing protein [Chloroflexi bacterium]|nr:DUF4392 domain-containing protein [Chloroflexota bacterium]